MNKKILFGYMPETKGHGKIIKNGISVLALSGALLIGGGIAGTVSADEVDTSANTTTASTVVVTTPTETPSETPTEPEVKSDIPTSVPSNSTQSQVVDTVDKAQSTLADNVDAAKQAGVIVNQGDKSEVVIDDSNAAAKGSEVLTDLNKQDQAVLNATAKQVANQKAYDSANQDLVDATEDGQNAINAADDKQDQVLAAADAAGVKTTVTTTDVAVDYVDLTGLEGQDLLDAMATNLALYKKAVDDSVAQTNASSDDMQAKLDAYNKAMADYKQKLADWNAGKLNTQNAIKWTNGTTVQAGSAATRVDQNTQWSGGSAGSWASAAIQGLDLSQNKDANFNNLFQLTNGSGSVVIQNTSNGNVTLTISNVQVYSAGSHDYYVAVWGSNNGGIAWGVFTMFNGSGSSSNSGENGGSGGGNVSGRILDSIKSFDWKVSTTNQVSSFTYNDIDNNQYITVNGINGTVNKGAYITQAGNKFSSGGGDVSQGSSGVVDTNGVQYVFNNLHKITVSGTHAIDGHYYPSIVAGIFGVSSEVKPPKPTQPNPITLDAKRFTVELPGAPEAPKQQVVDVHYYVMKETPTPEPPVTKTPTPVTPETPVAQASVLPSTGETSTAALSVVGIGMLGVLGFFGFAGKKKEEN